MNDMTPTQAERSGKLEGLGCKRKRTEDIRFTQGRGNYVDDLKLPGMLFGDFVRSSHPHARIKSIDTSKALALPGVKAVLTAADLKPLKLHYMPTLAGDVAAVLADEKVLFQNQEIAFVVAEDRYIAADATELVEVEYDRFKVKGLPEKFKTMKEIAWAAYNNLPPGMEPGLEAVNYYDPPNMTYPFGAYICVMDIDVDTGVAKTRRFYALDDCGTRINPMIIEGQVHGGLTEAFAVAMGQEITYDAQGNVMGASFMDFFLPTAVETPKWETDFTVTPSPHHPIGAKGVGESPHVGGVPCFSNAVNDAFAFLEAGHIPMPHHAWPLWKVADGLGLHA